MAHVSSRTNSSSRRTTPQRPVLTNVLHLVILPREWNSVMNAVRTWSLHCICFIQYLRQFQGCGDVEDIVANGATFSDASDCSTACTGDPIHLCGGALRLSLYEWVGTPLNVWHTPAVTGWYEVSRVSL